MKKSKKPFVLVSSQRAQALTAQDLDRVGGGDGGIPPKSDPGTLGAGIRRLGVGDRII